MKLPWEITEKILLIALNDTVDAGNGGLAVVTIVNFPTLQNLFTRQFTEETLDLYQTTRIIYNLVFYRENIDLAYSRWTMLKRQDEINNARKIVIGRLLR